MHCSWPWDYHSLSLNCIQFHPATSHHSTLLWSLFRDSATLTLTQGMAQQPSKWSHRHWFDLFLFLIFLLLFRFHFLHLSTFLKQNVTIIIRAPVVVKSITWRNEFVDIFVNPAPRILNYVLIWNGFFWCTVYVSIALPSGIFQSNIVSFLSSLHTTCCSACWVPGIKLHAREWLLSTGGTQLGQVLLLFSVAVKPLPPLKIITRRVNF